MEYNCNRRCDFLVFAIAASIVVGIVAAVLNFTAIITVGTAFLWVALGVALVYLAILLIATLTNSRCSVTGCARRTLYALIIGILGTILFALILLAIEFAATSTLGAIIVGLLLAFFTLIITSSSSLILAED